ncbi:MAG: hypothetical protein GXP01_06435 [Alphaproteobacteria bacterium]|nr:hypothetical protein [Alphaproteobacteria bacterium]
MITENTSEICINAIAYREGNVYVAQAIEYDIVAHAKQLHDLPMALMRSVADNIAITLSLGREPLAGVARAPDRFQDMFNEAQVSIEPVTPIDNPSPFPKTGGSIRYLETLEVA